jgi:hypothetical protein
MLRRLILIVLLLLAMTVPTTASDNVTYQSITVADTAIGISASVLNNGRGQAKACVARLETAQIRYRWDGVDPTSGEGLILEVGETLAIDDPRDARRIRFIRTGSSSGVLKVSCWS